MLTRRVTGILVVAVGMFVLAYLAIVDRNEFAYGSIATLLGLVIRDQFSQGESK